ncbi:sensor histidine kinase [Vibrio fluvialis]|nr:sensor histidine kinase [Vibrio fluvialis]ELS3715633.1 sensor histidine kinase [Vibrio fluvialis]ELX9691872.1 sensor histidine kinase [Vibrio fluvialis]MBY7947018.1 PAS domain S-box protein [Vibrio fluvialis]MBY8011656.1 PAS domain S-box protein [Vibrio fluvialis]
MLALLLILGVKSASTNIVKQWQLEQAQSHGEQRLLDYIGDVRKTLRRFYHLPYLITNELISQQLLSGDTSVMDEMQATLGKLDKAANTKGWYVLSSSGDVLVSSKDAENWNTHDGDAIVAKIHEQREGISIVTKAIGATPIYFLAAPIYIDLDIVGIVAVQIDLSVLADQWFANDELILFQNASGQYFLSSSPQYSADWLNAHPHITNAAQPIHLYNGTRLVLWNLQSEPYLAQSVTLDDLNWTLTYLTPMKSLYQTVNWISMSCVVAVLLLILLGTLRYEQYQKQISQRKLQEIVQESERRQRNMIQKTHVGLLLLDESGRIEEINPMAKRYFSLSELMVKNVRAWELFDIGNPNATIPLLLENLARNQELADITSVETMARRSDGSLFPILFSLTSVQWKDKRHYLVTILDISKRKKAEIALQTANQELQHRVEERTAELKSAQQELIDASKMAALGRMSSAITHELNQPLTGLRTLLSSNELLLARGETQLAQANMKLVHTLIDRMANMTTQLKSFAFNRPETLTPVSIPDALQEILRVHQARLDRVDVRVRMSSELPLVRGEEQRLRQVLGNLITNALDAMQDQPEAKLIISASDEAGKVMIRVRDNGCGIDEDKLTTIFEPFQTSKKMGEGLGLGLSITANSVRDMQGTIRAMNNPEGGMTFEVTLSASAETSNLAQ